MGGASFPKYNIPRLSHDEYIALRDRCITILQEFYVQVSCPPEGPSKQDHGDVDLLVCQPKHDMNSETVMAALAAVERTKCATKTVSYAVPLLRSSSETPAYAQIDVHRCDDGFLEWETFMGSYGDMGQILGVLNRGIGLTMNNKGFHVRVAEVEATNRKASMLHLTSGIPETLRFLGLDHKKFQRGFDSDEDVYAWCVSGRFCGPLSEKNQNANDRARLKKRPMFTKFMTDWLPAHPEIWESRCTFSRKEVLEQALAHFGVKEQYNEILSGWATRVKADELLDAAKEVIPMENEGLGQALKGLKRWTRIDEDGEARLLDEDEAKDDIKQSPDWLSEVPSHKKAEFLSWVKDHCQELRRRERERSIAIKHQRDVDRRSGSLSGSQTEGQRQ